MGRNYLQVDGLYPQVVVRPLCMGPEWNPGLSRLVLLENIYR